MKWTSLSLAFSVMLATSSLALGQWTLLDDFESSTLGPLGSQGGWDSFSSTAPDDDFRVAVKPADGTNQSLQVTGTNGATHTTNAFISLGSGIAEGATGTLFYRMAADASVGDLVAGASDLAFPATGWGNYEGYMRFSNGGIDARGSLTGGGGFSNIGTYLDNEWYNIWLVVDNAADLTTVWASQGGDPAVNLSATLGGAGKTHFRNGTTDPLVSLLIRVGLSEGSLAYLDDVYLDTSGVNLTLPAGVVVPEPVSMVLLGIGACTMFFSRRRLA